MAFGDIVSDNEKRFVAAFNKKVAGKKIVACNYTDDKFPYLMLDDGTAIFIQADDECNSPGVAVHEFTDPNSEETITTYLPEMF